MTDYNAISAGDIDTDSPITQNLLTHLRDNPIAITEGASGAPKIQAAAMAVNSVTTAAIQAGAVRRSELATADATHSLSVTGRESGTIILTGANHGFCTIGSYNGTDTSLCFGFGGGNTSAGTYGFYNPFGNDRSIYIDEKYIPASPPYNLGDGEIPLFIFVRIRNNEISGLSIAQDPPWAYNGPTNSIPSRVDSLGRKFRRVKRNIATGKEIKRFLYENKEQVLDYLAGDPEEFEDVEEEITDEIKNADKDIVPHCWSASDIGTDKVIMLNPYSNLMQKAFYLYEGGGANELRKLITKSNINIENTNITDNKPQSIQVVDFSFKRNRA